MNVWKLLIVSIQLAPVESPGYPVLTIEHPEVVVRRIRIGHYVLGNLL